MKYGEIAANIRDRLGIAELNAMQLAVGASRSRKIMLIAPTGSSSFRFVKSSAASRPVSEPLLSMAGTP